MESQIEKFAICIPTEMYVKLGELCKRRKCTKDDVIEKLLRLELELERTNVQRHGIRAKP